ncbi:hypothetical protein Bbelb_174460 [Branchiostoma belcheri]|nr:hypothetical protein Bbelb_447230 [Branchiostoma belcheri]KAI8504328.1 hypothetical protein Bbelb_174460 [Branchiostoma belcheri]
MRWWSDQNSRHVSGANVQSREGHEIKLAEGLCRSAEGSNRLDPEEDGWRLESSTHRLGEGAALHQCQGCSKPIFSLLWHLVRDGPIHTSSGSVGVTDGIAGADLPSNYDLMITI